MKFDYGLVPALIGVSIVVLQTQAAVALSKPEVAKIAQEITVQINSKTKYGSGVIIKKEGNTYTVLTAAHVLEIPDAYEIKTKDGRRYTINYQQAMKQLPGLDLALVKFTSNENYTAAKMGNSDESTLGTTAYVAGFLAPTPAINNSVLNFSPGEITANGSQRDGYGLIYDNNTQEGMSGGPVLNEKGELVGVHGRTNKDPNKTKTGLSLGIPINTFLKQQTTNVATAPKADDFYIEGINKSDKKDYPGAIAAYNQAIRLNPNYVYAYNNRGNARENLGDHKGAIEDYNQALRLNPNYDKAYYNRGSVRDDLGDHRGAIEDYNQALHINPNYTNAYYNRGLARRKLGDNKGAIEDYNQALRLNPNAVDAYNNRGNARDDLGDHKGAIEDYSQALRLNPNYDKAYYNRGITRSNLGDNKGAIEDYNQALRLNPNAVDAYYNRGIARYNLQDYKGAIGDYSQFLLINPNYAAAYIRRGNAYYYDGNYDRAISDQNQAIKLNPNNAAAYNGRGWAYYAKGDYDRTIFDQNQAIKLVPTYTNSYYIRGLAYKKKGSKNNAIQDFRKILELNKDSDLSKQAQQELRNLETK